MGLTPDVGLYFIGIKVYQQFISSLNKYIKDFTNINVLISNSAVQIKCEKVKKFGTGCVLNLF